LLYVAVLLALWCQVRVGSVDRTTGGSTFDVAAIFIHPRYIRGNRDTGAKDMTGDIALLKLAAPLPEQVGLASLQGS
jgi:hypothetical protein